MFLTDGQLQGTGFFVQWPSGQSLVGSPKLVSWQHKSHRAELKKHLLCTYRTLKKTNKKKSSCLKEQVLIGKRRQEETSSRQQSVAALGCNNDRISQIDGLRPLDLGSTSADEAFVKRPSPHNVELSCASIPSSMIHERWSSHLTRQTCSQDHQAGPQTLALSPISELKKQKGTAASSSIPLFLSLIFRHYQRLCVCRRRQTKMVNSCFF